MHIALSATSVLLTCRTFHFSFADLDQEVILSPALTLLSQQERKVVHVRLKPRVSSCMPSFTSLSLWQCTPTAQLCNSLSLKPLDYINIKADVLKVNDSCLPFIPISVCFFLWHMVDFCGWNCRCLPCDAVGRAPSTSSPSPLALKWSKNSWSSLRGLVGPASIGFFTCQRTSFL